MPTPMQTVTTSADYRVSATEQLIFVNQPAFLLNQLAPGGGVAHPAVHLTISGEVQALMTSVQAAGAMGINGINVSNTFDAGPTVTIERGGLLKVTATGGGAIAYAGGGQGAATLNNAGAVIVQADDKAVGLNNLSARGVLINSGQVSVISTGSDAIGLETYGYRVQALNSGEITVFGHDRATGVWIADSQGVFRNTGVIVARDDNPVRDSVGVLWNVGPTTSSQGEFVNEGTIEGDRSLQVEISFGSAADNVIVNKGRLIGTVFMGGGAAETLVNNGVIDGAVRFFGGGSIYDGRAGTVLGEVVASDNNGGGLLLGGSGGETLSGGYSNDTISGGGGDDLIAGGRGDDRLDGGAGVNTLSFARALEPVRVDLAAQTASDGGTKTLANFQIVLGGRYADTLIGGVGDDTLMGGDGADVLTDIAGSNRLWGEAGDDSLAGGVGFDNMNGNTGNDTLHAGDGEDWVSGGKDQDLLYGDAAFDIVLGNLGDDTCDGGAGADWVRGGQGDDIVRGGAGDDLLWGDRGADTLTGGTGADVFNTFVGAGLDRVTDFSFAEGDRVHIEAGASYSVRQVGVDTVVDLGGGDQLILERVDAASLPAGFIV
ncbi:calcium-binding protein [Phenylobacterium deserti]|nr:calcium-binding protein [Phenylobacterium deserti]